MLGPIFIDIAGPELTTAEIKQLQNPVVGGVVLFTRNYQSKTQLTALCAQLHSLRTPELLITVDHEGGRVQRFIEDFTRLPTMQTFGAAYNFDPVATLHDAEQWGQLMASELKACGVDLSFAPVLDLDKGISSVLNGGRAIAADIQTTVMIAKAYMQGMHRAGMATVGKHFPGHGSISLDSHVDLPRDSRDFAKVMQDDMQTFIQLMPSLDAIMPAHIIFSEVDTKPVSLSHYWLSTVLREQLQYKGVIISDCLSMAGAAEFAPDPRKRIELALSAGCDIVLICNNPCAVHEIVEDYSFTPSEKLTAKIENLRQKVIQ
jgi:beta-N-acetylhexosaminidase